MNMGRALSIIALHEAKEIAMHMDVDAFYAPSECHDLVSRGEERRARAAWRHALAVSGLPRRRRFLSCVVSQNHRHMERLIGSLVYRIYPHG